MEISSKRIKRNPGDKINIYFLGDIHEGNCNSNEKSLKEAVEIIRNDPIGYWFGMGDYIDAITHTGDKRFDPLSIAKKYNIRDLKDLPYRQAQQVFIKLSPIADKCLALLCGNHEEAYIKYNSSDVYGKFVEMFKTSAHRENKSPFKMGYDGFYRLIIHNREKHILTISFALNHGIGGAGFLPGYKVNIAHKCFKYMYADVNVMGHIHQLMHNRKPIVTVSQRNDKLNKINRYWGSSGCFLNSYVTGNNNYFEHKAGVRGESDIGMLKFKIKINANSWDGKFESIYL
jgi:hypothetical protein